MGSNKRVQDIPQKPPGWHGAGTNTDRLSEAFIDEALVSGNRDELSRASLERHEREAS